MCRANEDRLLRTRQLRRREEGFYRLSRFLCRPFSPVCVPPSSTLPPPPLYNWIRENNSRFRSISRDNAFRGEHMLIFANGGAPDALNQRFFNSSPIAPSGSRKEHIIGCASLELLSLTAQLSTAALLLDHVSSSLISAEHAIRWPYVIETVNFR